VVRVRTLLEDAVLLVLIVIGLPLAILLLGTPIVLLVRLLIAIAQRLLSRVAPSRRSFTSCVVNRQNFDRRATSHGLVPTYR